MRKLISILYSCAAGLEQAYVTFETIKQTHKAALLTAKRNAPPAKQPMGFAASLQKNTSEDFTNSNP